MVNLFCNFFVCLYLLVFSKNSVAKGLMSIQGICRQLFVASVFLFCALAPAFSQTLVVTPGVTSLTIHPGDTNVALPISLGPSSYSGPVSITLTGLPSGISFAPLTLAPGGSGVLQLNATVSADTESFPPATFTDPNTSSSTITVLAVSGSLSATANVSLTVSLENPSFTPAAANINLPIVNINTNGVPIVDKTTDVPGTITITSADGQTSYLPGTAGTDDTATFHLHGNSTFYMPKKPYNVKLNTSTDLLTHMGLVCPYVTSSNQNVCDKSKSYILLANYDDKTFLRDWSASALANAIPSGGDYLAYTPGSPTPSGNGTLTWWAPHSLFVELYVNGQYEGNYQLIEQVKIDGHRINITEMTNTATSGAALTGGYLLEIDQRQGEDFNFITPQGVYVGLIDPDFTPEVPQQETYISNYVNTAEDALFGSNYTDPVLGWRAYFDEAAAVNFYIVNDVMGNVDGGRFYSSDYFYKDINNPLLYMGPIWDFDVSSGNVNYYPITDPALPWMQTQSPWYAQWFTDPSFKAAVVQQWNALKTNGIFTTWLASIQTEAGTLQQSQVNNFGRWPMQGMLVWPNAVAPGSYNGELSYFTNWINARIGYLDAQFNHKAQTSTTLTSTAQTIAEGTTLYISSRVSGATIPTGTVSFTNNGAIVGVGILDGTGYASAVVSLAAGSGSLQAIYLGDANNALSVSSLVPIYVAPPPSQTITNLTASASTLGAGQAVTLSAVIVPTSGTKAATGTVIFSASQTPLQTVPVVNGIATLQTSGLSAGANTIQASYSGDFSNQSSTSNTVSVQVGQIQPTITWAQPAAISYGITLAGILNASAVNGSTAVPGTYTYTNGTSPITPTSTLPAGSYTLTVNFAPTDTNTYKAATGTVSLTVNKVAAGGVLLSASTNSVFLQNPTSFTATVSSMVSPPTGSVVFFDGTTSVGMATLTSGTAQLTVSSLAVGTHSITAVYSGDNNFFAGTSSAVSTVVADFSLASSTTSQTVQPGSTASYALTLTPDGTTTFPSAVTLAATGLPTGATATFTPPSVASGASTASVTLAVTVPSQVSYLKKSSPFAADFAPVALAVFLLPFSRRMRRSANRLQRLTAWMLLLIACGVGAVEITGCGGSSKPAQQSYIVMVTGTSGALAHSTTVTLIVQ
jgi:hypothetical protein